MARRSLHQPRSGGSYAKFAWIVIAVAAVVALVAGDSGPDTPEPQPAHRVEPATGKPDAAPAVPEMAQPDPVEAPDAEAAPPEVDAPDEGEAKVMPKPKKAGPPNRPTPQQLEMLKDQSRARSGSPPGGD